jgi:2,4-dienoyl-CoA reductase-like NADH-dependent reductase (Old Yellow Enzyme family)
MTFRNGVRSRNRVWLAPMTNSQSHADGSLSDDELRWLRMRASGGFGVVETCASHVALDGQGWAGELGIFDDRLLPGLQRLASALEAGGALGIVQIFHGGVRAPSSLTGQIPWSATDAEVPRAERPRAGTEEDLLRVIGQFKDAAVRAHSAGFAGVELHGAHGYLFGQFLGAMNTRSDRWGGSLENRARLLREAMRAVRGAVPDRFVVGVRLSPEDYGNARGLDLDESLQVARWLAADALGRAAQHEEAARGSPGAALPRGAAGRRGPRGGRRRVDPSGGGGAPRARRQRRGRRARGDREPRLGRAHRRP